MKVFDTPTAKKKLVSLASFLCRNEMFQISKLFQSEFQFLTTLVNVVFHLHFFIYFFEPLPAICDTGKRTKVLFLLNVLFGFVTGIFLVQLPHHASHLNSVAAPIPSILPFIELSQLLSSN